MQKHTQMKKELIQDLTYLSCGDTEKPTNHTGGGFLPETDIPINLYSRGFQGRRDEKQKCSQKKDAPHHFRTIPGTPTVLATAQHPNLHKKP